MTDIVERLRDAERHFAAIIVEGATSYTLSMMREAAAEIERLRALHQWQPIDTAPRDGTAIIALLRYRNGTVFDEPLSIRWHDPWGQWVFSGCLIGIQNSAKDEDNVDPTHWMPLPPPPGDTP